MHFAVAASDDDAKLDVFGARDRHVRRRRRQLPLFEDGAACCVEDQDLAVLAPDDEHRDSVVVLEVLFDDLHARRHGRRRERLVPLLLDKLCSRGGLVDREQLLRRRAQLRARVARVAQHLFRFRDRAFAAV